MQILRTLMILALANTATQEITRPEVVMVSAVVDGQTISVAGYSRVRLSGIKAPRFPHGLQPGDPFGREAKERLEGIVIRRYVRLEFEPGGRRAYVLLEDGTCVNELLVREGLASAERSGSGRPTSSRRAAIVRAEESARSTHRGIWSGR